MIVLNAFWNTLGYTNMANDNIYQQWFTEMNRFLNTTQSLFLNAVLNKISRQMIHLHLEVLGVMKDDPELRSLAILNGKSAVILIP